MASGSRRLYAVKGLLSGRYNYRQTPQEKIRANKNDDENGKYNLAAFW